MAVFAWLLLGPGLAAAQSTPVQAATLQPAIWRTIADVSASLQARETATLAPAQAGLVTAVLFHSGDQVAAGQVLVQLDNQAATAQLALDQAKLTQAERESARTQKLMSIAGASQSALEQAAATAAEARAQVALDQANLAQLQIRAPFAGTLGIRNIDPGDYLTAGQAVVSLTGTGPLRVLFSLPQTQAGGLALGDPFTFNAPTSNGATITATAKLTALSPAQTQATDARDLEGQITGNAAGLVPGMAGVVNIATGQPIPAFAVPSTALNDSTLGPFVFVIAPNNTLSTVYVTIYGSAGANTLVSTNGLTAGERVVALGGFKLSDGAAVSIQAP